VAEDGVEAVCKCVEHKGRDCRVTRPQAHIFGCGCRMSGTAAGRFVPICYKEALSGCTVLGASRCGAFAEAVMPEFDCITCGTKLKAADSQVGKFVRCPRCKTTMR